MGTADHAERPGAKPPLDEAESAGREAAESGTFGALVAVGLVVYGCVHLVIAWLFWQIAFGGGDRPISALSQNPVGRALLWAAAAGMGVLVLWRVAQAALPPAGGNGRRRLGTTVTQLFEAAIYTLIAISAIQAAVTGGRRGSVQGEGQSEQSLGTALLAHLWGRAIVMIIAVALAALGVQLFRSAISRSFADDLRPGVARPVLWAGAAGLLVKGVAVVIIAGLLAWAAVAYDPAKTAGLEAMLQTLRATPFGPALLTAMGAGLALYGVYCFIWSANARR